MYVCMIGRCMQHSPGVTDVIQHAYFEHVVRWIGRRSVHMYENPVRYSQSSSDAKIIARRQWPISRASLTRVIERYYVPNASKRSRACFASHLARCTRDARLFGYPIDVKAWIFIGQCRNVTTTICITYIDSYSRRINPLVWLRSEIYTFEHLWMFCRIATSRLHPPSNNAVDPVVIRNYSSEAFLRDEWSPRHERNLSSVLLVEIVSNREEKHDRSFLAWLEIYVRYLIHPDNHLPINDAHPFQSFSRFHPRAKLTYSYFFLSWGIVSLLSKQILSIVPLFINYHFTLEEQRYMNDVLAMLRMY